ncbi:translation initiation factor eIF2 alpha subunit [Ephemerocybe angulata]|nr:translation initiation factor eIF2 alpha subunit [Tulosesus angulatus]
MRYYEQKYPEVDELVMVQVRQIAEMGAYVKLLEYDNTEGMILLSELSRRRIRSVQKLIRVGRNEVVVVLRVDKEKGYIDLSKRRVSPEDIVKCEERYMKSKAVASILRHVASKIPSLNAEGEALPSSEPLDKEGKRAARKARQAAAEEGLDAPALAPQSEADVAASGVAASNEEEKLEHLYDTIGWPLGKKYGHPYDAFKLALTEPDVVFSALAEPIPASTLSILTSTIARRLTPQPIKLRADIELTCYTPAGIDAIKKALRAGEKQSTEVVPIKAKLVAPPLYVLSTNATDKYAAVERLEKAIEAIQNTIEEEGGNLVLKMKPKAVSETDEQDLAQLMAKAGMENAEVSGDEEEEEA